MTADSKTAFPAPDDDVPPKEPRVFDEEAIDLSHPEEMDDAASAVSFSGRSAPRNGGGPSSGGSSSGSGVRSWEQLVRETGADSDSGKIHYGTPLLPDNEEASSDKNLLREVLAGEPSPSDIIFKDPSLSEVHLPPVEQPPAVSFALPPDLATTPHAEDSSILSSSLPFGPGQSGFTSDVWGPPSSGVDLLRPGPPSHLSGDSQERTDEMSDPQFVGAPSEDSSHALLGAMPAGSGHDESSAVDLGSHGVIDLPYPLGLDSSVESARMKRSGPPAPPSHGADPESGAVDLLAASEEFDLGLSDVTTTPSWEAAREDLPPTVPMVPAGKNRVVAWAGGGAAGLLVGVAACVGIWFAGLLPTQTAKTTTAPVAAPPSPELAELRAQALAANQARDEEAKKTVAANAEAQRAKDQLVQATAQSKAAASQVQAARDRAQTLAAQVRQAEAGQAGLKESVQKLTADKTSADAKLREVDANLSVMRDRIAGAEADAKTAKDEFETAEAARKQSAAFAAELAQRLRIAPNASSAEALAALDQALARPTAEPTAAVPTHPSASIVRTPEQSQRVVHTGIQAYRGGDFAAAEHEFAQLASSPDTNAIPLYFLGLAQWHQGKLPAAEASFRRGWELERASRPPPGEVEAAFERLDRVDREAVNQFRQ